MGIFGRFGLGTLLLLALGATGFAAKPPAGAATKNEPYYVVQVGEDVKVIKKSELKNEEKSCKDRYQKDTKAYQESKKSSAKSKDGGEAMPKPEKAHYTVKVLNNKATFKTREEAEEWKVKYQEGKSGKSDASKDGKKKSSNW